MGPPGSAKAWAPCWRCSLLALAFWAVAPHTIMWCRHDDRYPPRDCRSRMPIARGQRAVLPVLSDSKRAGSCGSTSCAPWTIKAPLLAWRSLVVTVSHDACCRGGRRISSLRTCLRRRPLAVSCRRARMRSCLYVGQHERRHGRLPRSRSAMGPRTKISARRR